MAHKHSLRARMRAFHIWQVLGENPWAVARKKKKKADGGFYTGAFDSIPFLNDDAKRTFVHLLLRPGYMIRDYIRGDHERYLSPLSALVIFFSFFALVAALLKPLEEKKEKRNPMAISIESKRDSLDRDSQTAQKTMNLLSKGYLYLHLDEFPEEVDTRQESALAALESTLRSQGFTLFLGEFFVLWLALCIALRKFRLRMSAWAAMAAYYLCQTSFFMLFYVVFTWGQSTSVNILIFLIVMMVDLRQLLGIGWKKCFGRSLAIGWYYGLLYVGIILLVSLAAFGVAYLRVS
ncbi:MAG: DUF3667 domain-containing protein [Bacteroidales bacterium]|nr:DUF3667 domain-containing protein [Bacteroidales bacterium]